MQIVLFPKTYNLSHWTALLSILAKQYPDGYLSARVVDVFYDQDVRYLLTVDDHEMRLADHQFFNSIDRPPLGPPGSYISDEVYNEMRASKWLIDGWYNLGTGHR